MFLRLSVLFLFFFSICFGELHNFQIGAISYEWEKKPDFDQCKQTFFNASVKCYDPIPLEDLRKSSREEMLQWLADSIDQICLDFNRPDSSVLWLSAKENGINVGSLLIETNKYPEEIYLSYMAVDPAHQRRGIATSMVRGILEQFPEAKRFVVITRKVNEGAIAFYHAIGFADSTYTHEGYSPELYQGFELQR